MACACNKGRKTQYEVVTNGRTVFTSSSRPTADAVSKRYEGSTVREKSNAAAAKTTTK